MPADEIRSVLTTEEMRLWWEKKNWVYLLSTLISFSNESSLPLRAFLSIILIACIWPSSLDSASLTCENAPLKQTCVRSNFMWSNLLVFCRVKDVTLETWWDYNYRPAHKLGQWMRKKRSDASWQSASFGLMLPLIWLHLERCGHAGCFKMCPKPDGHGNLFNNWEKLSVILISCHF